MYLAIKLVTLFFPMTKPEKSGLVILSWLDHCLSRRQFPPSQASVMNLSPIVCRFILILPLTLFPVHAHHHLLLRAHHLLRFWAPVTLGETVITAS